MKKLALVCKGATLPFQSHTHFIRTNMNGPYFAMTKVNQSPFTMVVLRAMYCCYHFRHVETCVSLPLQSTTSCYILLLLGLLESFTIKPFTILVFYSSALVQY